ncbi:hypothetical protein R1flu_026387 [Riccia fluitans]|uniref:Uncharacterized protein n=1 Tax=Riccia fluitans TaxID=41844 RepID=A0ABD1XGE0_9MARC
MGGLFTNISSYARTGKFNMVHTLMRGLKYVGARPEEKLVAFIPTITRPPPTGLKPSMAVYAELVSCLGKCLLTYKITRTSFCILQEGINGGANSRALGGKARGLTMDCARNQTTI